MIFTPFANLRHKGSVSFLTELIVVFYSSSIMPRYEKCFLGIVE